MPEVWMRPLMLAMLLTPAVLYVGYFAIVPRILVAAYKSRFLADRFQRIDGSEGAGSIDIVYFNLYFDVRKDDVVIRGAAPDARHWQVGAFDGFARLISGAYVNHKTATIDEDGDFYVRLTARPIWGETENVLDCSESPRGLVIFRIVLPAQTVKTPVVLQQHDATKTREMT